MKNNFYLSIALSMITISTFGAAPAKSLEFEIAEYEKRIAECRLKTIRRNTAAQPALQALDTFLDHISKLADSEQPGSLDEKALTQAEITLYESLSKQKNNFGFLIRYQHFMHQSEHKLMKLYKQGYEENKAEIARLKALLPNTDAARSQAAESWAFAHPHSPVAFED